MPEVSEEERRRADFGSYPAESYFDDLARLTKYRADPELIEILARRSWPTLRWMGGKGVRFVPAYGRQAFLVDGQFKFWGGVPVEVSGGGHGLVQALHDAALREGIRSSTARGSWSSCTTTEASTA
jgi:tricarballylate dehydrogenase